VSRLLDWPVAGVALRNWGLRPCSGGDLDGDRKATEPRIFVSMTPRRIASPGPRSGVPCDSMATTYDTVGSLYDELAEPAADSAAAGETLSTRAKETVDNDVETAALEELMQ
jgi:hypothetical protein